MSSAPIADVASISTRNARQIYAGAADDLPLLQIANRHGNLLLAMQGAHVLSYTPRDAQDVLWVSPRSEFATGKPIRGGIPLCMPWFGKLGDKPLHGIARIHDWLLVDAAELENGATTVTLALRDNEATRAHWPHPFEFRLTVTLAESLTLQLQATHHGDEPVPFAAALHTYFAVDNAFAARISGLDGCTYVDKPIPARDGEPPRRVQQGDVVLPGSGDRVYLHVPAQQTIADAERTIVIKSDDTHSAVVWNAGEHALNVADIGPDYPHYLCVERGDVFDNAVTLAPGETYTATLSLSLA